MPFVEIAPPRKAAGGIGTGVRISVTERLGLRVSLAGEALAAIGGGGDATRVRVLIDRDPVMPRLRIVASPDGRFRLGKPPLSDRWRSVTLGRDTGLPMTLLKGADCTWEAVDGQAGIDIDLPRGLRSGVTTVDLPAANGRTNKVTLPGRAPVREKERV